jgi:hypothetical protein
LAAHFASDLEVKPVSFFALFPFSFRVRVSFDVVRVSGRLRILFLSFLPEEI